LPYPSARFLFFFLHGNAEDLGKCYNFAHHIREQFHVHVLVVEYPGYGICPGVPSEASVNRNARACFRYVLETLKWPLDSIQIIGRSIGTGPAVQLATEYNVAGLVLISPFTSVQDIFKHAVGPVAWLFEDMYRSIDKIDQVRSPTMIVHGRRDHLIPVVQGEALFKRLNVRKLLVDPAEMEHNTNLLTDANYFVLPMLHFFPIPDYCFEDIVVPPEAYDKKQWSTEYAYSSRRAVQMNAIQPPQVYGDDGVDDDAEGMWGALKAHNMPFTLSDASTTDQDPSSKSSKKGAAP
jgi:esterase/lipase